MCGCNAEHAARARGLRRVEICIDRAKNAKRFVFLHVNFLRIGSTSTDCVKLLSFPVKLCSLEVRRVAKFPIVGSGTPGSIRGSDILKCYEKSADERQRRRYA